MRDKVIAEAIKQRELRQAGLPIRRTNESTHGSLGSSRRW